MKFSKRVYTVINVSVILGVSFASALDDDELWKDFKIRFNKTYESESEEKLRMAVFLDNKQFVESHNTKSHTSFTQGINPLSDLTTEEINRSRNGFRLNHSIEQRPIDGLLTTLLLALNATGETYGLNATTNNEKSWYENLVSPSKLDWRTAGRVSRVKDQGSCGSCWAFATTGALESILAAQDRGVLLSEQNLVDCSQSYGNYGCGGGLMDQALRYVRDHGIMSSLDYPYTAKDESCKFKRVRSVMHVRGYAMIPRGNEVLLRLALSLSGPIPVAIDAGGRSFHSYKSGVYNDTTCRNTDSALNHAVLLVGYGTDLVGGDYWIVKNSWGNKWGDNGYIRIARNRKNLCGIASYAVLPIP